MDEDELISYIALSIAPGVGPVTARALIRTFGSASEVFRKTSGRQMRVHGVGPATASALATPGLRRDAESRLRDAYRSNVAVFGSPDDRYPHRLRQCQDSPLCLYVKGNVDMNHSRVVSMVGTRRATGYGQVMVRRILEALKTYKPVVVSGMAHGIDTFAHLTALEFGLPTIGVLAHGLDTMYPASNRPLASRMLSADNSLISEYPLGMRADRLNFPARNRIVAGLSDAVIVIESAERGGALITAALGLDYNREVYAVPGKVTDSMSAGCNMLIRDNMACLLTDGMEIVKALGWADEHVKISPDIQRSLFPDLDTEEKRLYDKLRDMGGRPVGIDDISSSLGKPASKVLSTLLSLEIKGIIESKPGGRYVCV